MKIGVQGIIVEKSDARKCPTTPAMIFVNIDAIRTPMHFQVRLGRHSVKVNDFRRTCNVPGSKPPTFDEYEQTVKLLTIYGKHDILSTDKFDLTVMDYYQSSVELYQWLKQQDYSFQTRSLDDVVNIVLARSHTYTPSGNDALLLHLLIPSGYISELTGPLGSDHISKICGILRNRAMGLSINYWSFHQRKSRSELSIFKNMDDILVELVALCPDEFTKSLEGDAKRLRLRTSMMLGFLLEIPYNALKWILKNLLHILSEAGVDIVEYGRIETEYYEDPDLRTFIDVRIWDWRSRTCDYQSFELLEIKFGASPSDFDIKFEDLYITTELMVPFWILVEGSEDDFDWDWTFQITRRNLDSGNDLPVPGAWPED
jgi:hypothetical protein